MKKLAPYFHYRLKYDFTDNHSVKPNFDLNYSVMKMHTHDSYYM